MSSSNMEGNNNGSRQEHEGNFSQFPIPSVPKGPFYTIDSMSSRKCDGANSLTVIDLPHFQLLNEQSNFPQQNWGLPIAEAVRAAILLTGADPDTCHYSVRLEFLHHPAAVIFCQSSNYGPHHVLAQDLMNRGKEVFDEFLQEFDELLDLSLPMKVQIVIAGSRHE